MNNFNKETIKSVILTLLIANSILLTVQIWLDPRIWTNVTPLSSFISTIPLIGGIGTPSDDGEPIEALTGRTLTPRLVLLCGDVYRNVYYRGETPYEDALALYDNVMQAAVAGGKSTELTEEEYRQLLTGRCVFVRYGMAVPASLIFARYASDGKHQSRIPRVTDAVIVKDASGAVAIVLRDSVSGGHIKYLTELKGVAIDGVIAKVGERRLYEFAYELGLDTISPLSVVQSDPYVLFLVGNDEGRPNVMDGIRFSQLLERERYGVIVEAFGLRPSNLRKSIASDGTVKYVENTGTITISPDGTVHYSALSEAFGIGVGTGAATEYRAVDAVVRLAGNIYRTVTGEDVSLCLSEDTAIGGVNGTIQLRYNAGGLPVFDDQPAVEATVANGRIATFTMRIATYAVTGHSTRHSPIAALDAYAAARNTTVALRDLVLGYDVTKESDTYAAQWRVMIRQ